jgi:BirA family biotin operon repressor/biotin-[acetyl-CoA-carboxylase] ligase
MLYPVLRVLADGQKYTVEQLIERLALSSTQLEQAIRALAAYGIRLHSPAAHSYQLHEPLELLEHSRILAALSADNRQRLAQLEIHSVLDSTNRYALEGNRADPYACLAEYQTAGRGRQGRKWVSPYASGISLSIKYRYTTMVDSLAGLNIALAVTVGRVLWDLGAQEVGLKWPNDVLWQGRKLAGLLLESRGKEVVIGIGLNVKMPSTDDTKTITQPWVDLYTLLGRYFSRNTLAALLIDHCLHTLIIYPQVGLAAFRHDWHRFDLSYGQPVTLKIPQRPPKKAINSPLKDDTIISHVQLKNNERVAHSNFQKNQIAAATCQNMNVSFQKKLLKDTTQSAQPFQEEFVTGTAWGIDEGGALLLQVGQKIRRYVYGEVSLRL